MLSLSILSTQRAVQRLCLGILLVIFIHFAVPTAALSSSPNALVSSKVLVPSSMSSAPFDIDRYLNVPPNFEIAVYARIENARFMAIAPNGDLLVSQPSTGKVLLVQSNGSGDPLVSDFVTDLNQPHDIVFHTIDHTTYIYISESDQIDRYIYNSGDTSAHDRQVVVNGLPDSSTAELKGAYAHALKNIALDTNHKLYVSIGSSCNACVEDTISDPLRGAIYQYEADGTNGRLFAQGLRNAEGLAFVPGTNDLWAAVNNRDNIAYPKDDGSGNKGEVIPSYVDNHPPESSLEYSMVVTTAGHSAIQTPTRQRALTTCRSTATNSLMLMDMLIAPKWIGLSKASRRIQLRWD